MSFLRRNNSDKDKQQAVPAPNTPAPPPADSGSSGGGGIKQWLIDSYNGLYKVVLEPNMPTKQTIFILIVGVLIGLSWGYLTVEFTGANPDRLNQAAQDQWILMVAGNYERGFYGEEAAAELLRRVNNPAETVSRLISNAQSQSDAVALQSLQPIAQTVSGTPPPEAPFGGILDWVIILALVIIITPIVVLLWRMLIAPNIFQPIVDRIKQATNAEYRETRQRERAALQAMKEQRAAKDAMKAEGFVDQELGSPVMQSLSIFDRNRNYDDSMEIELPLNQGGDFLGQCGAVVAEPVQPDPVAVEIWLFDMRSQQNLKKVFVTPAGSSDQTVMNRLNNDPDINPADIVIAEPNATLTIDSDNLRLQAKMSQLNIAGDGRFSDFQMQLRAWQKSAGAAPPAGGPPSMAEYDNMQFDPPPAVPQAPPQQPPAPTGARPMSDYDDIQFDPPPAVPQAPPQQPQTPSVGSLMGQQPPASGQRLSPPPINYPPATGGYPDNDEDDDDPFGATGDFTPLGRP